MLNKEIFWKGKKVLITGSTGFKGSWLTLALRHAGAKIVGISSKKLCSNLLISNFINFKEEIKLYNADITNFKLLRKIITKEKPQIIFHLAAQPIVKKSYLEPYKTFCINALGTVHILEIIKDINSKIVLVNVTTDKVYKQNKFNKDFKVNDQLGGNDIYSASKSCSDIIASAYYNSFYKNNNKVGIATARAGNVIGGFDWAEDRIIPDFFRSIIKKKKLTIRMPNSVRPWQHVIDVVNGYMLLAKNLYKNPKKFSKSWNFGPKKNSNKSVIKLINQLNKINNNKVKVVIQKSNFHEEKSIKLDSSESIKELNWKQKINFFNSIKLTSIIYEKFLNKKLTKNDFSRQIERYL